jgi:hypothetical protein
MVTFNDTTFLLNFMKRSIFIQKFLVGDTRTQGQTGDLISIRFVFKEK